jgi:hypothetical protein
VVDLQTNLVERNITLALDDQRVSRRGFTYNSGTDRLEYTPTGNLPYGRHVVTLVAKDSVGLSTTREWNFRIVRP